MIVPWEDAADLILPHVAGCEWPIARQALLLAAREFYTQTHAWRESCAPLYTVKGLADYDVLDVPQSTVIALRDVYIGANSVRRHLTPDGYRDAMRRYSVPGSADAVAWIEDRLWICPAPYATGEIIKVTTILIPRTTCEGLPSELWELHVECLADGALARLYQSPNKPYTDTTLAGYHRGLFEAKHGGFRVRADTGGTDVVERTCPQWW